MEVLWENDGMGKWARNVPLLSPVVMSLTVFFLLCPPALPSCLLIVSLSICLLIYLSFSLSVCLLSFSLSVNLSFCSSVYLSVCLLSVSLSVSLSVCCQSVCLPVSLPVCCQSVNLSDSRSVSKSVSLSVCCQSVCLSVGQSSWRQGGRVARAPDLNP